VVLGLNTGVFCSLARALEPVLGEAAWQCFLHRWAKVDLKCGLFSCRVEGRENVSGPCILASNHRSALDIAVIAATVPPPVYFLARENLLRVPVIGSVLKRGGHLVAPDDDRRGVGRLFREVKRRIDGGGHVVVFPEGTRSTDDRVLPFGAGAFRFAHMAACPLVPVAIAGTGNAIPKGSRLIMPSRLAISFLEPRWVSRDASGSTRYHESVRSLVAETVRRLEC
jgi:1-acyl-sn-glycerol-3-phosphate acyltransferase